VGCINQQTNDDEACHIFHQTMWGALTSKQTMMKLATFSIKQCGVH